MIACTHKRLGGAIVQDRAVRFLQLCTAFDLVMARLCDTPAFMVEREGEKIATIGHISRMFARGAELTCRGWAP
ncbi:acetyl-CoA carboxylase carboxyltransferase component [Bradyrhizobium sp. USDA 4509]